MATIVRDDGFHSDDLSESDFLSRRELARGVESPTCLHLDIDEDPSTLQIYFPWLRTIRIPFNDFTDGRGFSLASRLRQLGYTGRLRAAGHVICDQYPLARRSGFDEVAIEDELAERQPEDQWLAKSNWQILRYQERLLASKPESARRNFNGK